MEDVILRRKGEKMMTKASGKKLCLSNSENFQPILMSQSQELEVPPFD